MFAETHGRLGTLGNNPADESWRYWASREWHWEYIPRKSRGPCADSGLNCLRGITRVAEAGRSLEFSGSRVAFGVRTQNLFSIVFPAHLSIDLCTKDPFKQLPPLNLATSTCPILLIN